jgi:hypothetical protein
MKETQAARLQISKETTEFLKFKTSRIRDAMMIEDMFHLKGTSQQ